MRAAPLIVAILFAASLEGAVQMTVAKDGSKLICNVPSGNSSAGSESKWLARQRNRHSPYDAMIDRASAAYGVDPVLVRAVIQVESDFNPNCVSRTGARGLMQLMPETAERYGVRHVHDPEENIRGGVRFLADLLEMFSSDLPRVLAAYNAGEHAVMRYSGIPPYAETIAYVKRALTVYHGTPYGEATAFAGRRSRRNALGGGFRARVIDPLATALVPNMKYLGASGR